ncbi:hypothetical protein C4J81_12935 [Deltaproteobacteria bacterium Smac51]|nr:hypothetical protein C4J81_12935 [Deltaproteobacteria bacterium Smac51]
MSKPDLVVIVEGQTEVSSLKRTVGQYLYDHTGCEAIFAAIGKTGADKGGHKSFEIFINQIQMFAKQYPGVYISTFFDYYGFNPRWKEFEALKKAALKKGDDIIKTIGQLEELMAMKVLGAVGISLREGHFLPYIQLHELEALLFADTDILGEELQPLADSANLKQEFMTIRTEFDNCEMINDSPLTAPSKRIEKLARYVKGKSARSQAGPIMEKIGLLKIRQACPRFDQWIKTLEGLK